MAKTEPIKRALELRKGLVKDKKILVCDFSSTLQGIDTSRVIDLMPNIYTNEFIFRTKVNIKEIDFLASKEYNVKYFDVKKHGDNEIQDFAKKSEFDFPLWFKYNKGFEMKSINNYNLPFIVQVAGCNFHDGSKTGGCLFCFVDDKSNDGIMTNGKAYLSTKDYVDSFINAREKVKKIYKENDILQDFKVLRISGGEPTLVLDFILEAWNEIDKRNLDIFGQIDSNLSTASVIEEFEKNGIYTKNILRKLSEYPIKVLTAIKGVDKENLEENVQSYTTLFEQKKSLIKFLEAGFDIYPQMYNPNPSSLKNYLIEMDNIIENFSLRAHIGPIKIYGPTKQRLAALSNFDGKDTDDNLLKYKDNWDSNYRQNIDIMNDYLNKKYKLSYKEVARPDVTLKLKKS